MRSLKFLLLVLLAPFSFTATVLADENKASFTYYYFDGWVLCNKITVIVNDQNKKHGKNITIATIKVGEGQSEEEIKKAKLTTHGIVAKDKNGKLVAAVEGHNYGKAKVVEVIDTLLQKK